MINALKLTPSGHVVPTLDEAATALPAVITTRLTVAFARGSGHGLLSLGTYDVGAALPPTVAWWRDIATRLVTAICMLPEVAERSLSVVPAPTLGDLQTLAWTAPPMDGAEYLTTEVL